MIAAFFFFLFLSLCQTVSGYNVTYDDRSIIVNDQRVFLVSGCVHYPRSTPAMWPDLFAKAKANGLNTIQTYVFWNLHESTKGIYNFTDRADLKHFLDLAKQHDLYVTLRIGPFIASEWDFGGLPVWLNWEKNIQFRVYNEAWMREMKAWMQYVVEYVDEYFAKNGGPIILTQIENEYNIRDQKYVQWCGELTKELQTGTPWVMCNGESASETINVWIELCQDLFVCNLVCQLCFAMSVTGISILKTLVYLWKTSSLLKLRGWDCLICPSDFEAS